jgi:hypothetical protein
MHFDRLHLHSRDASRTPVGRGASLPLALFAAATAAEEAVGTRWASPDTDDAAVPASARDDISAVSLNWNPCRPCSS